MMKIVQRTTYVVRSTLSAHSELDLSVIAP